MGYETKLLIVQPGHTGDEYVRSHWVIEGEEPYKPYKEDENGDWIKTGRRETWVNVIATIDLSKCGYDSEIHQIDWKNTDKNHHWYWYGSDGNTQIKEDCYEEKSSLIPIDVVLTALKKDAEDSDYRRFKWAIALLESMEDDKTLSILFYGH